MRIVPCTLREANDFVEAHHRHHGRARGCRYCLALVDDGRLCAVAVCGRPVARHLDDGTAVEIVRLCTDGTRNAASKLLAACRRAAQALGYRRLLTYTLAAEGGASLRAAGFAAAADVGGGSWDRPGRRRRDKHPTGAKTRWEASL